MVDRWKKRKVREEKGKWKNENFEARWLMSGIENSTKRGDRTFARPLFSRCCIND
jgi:hypothetical protein